MNLLDAHDRDRKSHEIALSVRPKLDEIAKKYNGSVKAVEVPPICDVAVIAEVYGLDYNGQIKVVKDIRKLLKIHRILWILMTVSKRRKNA